MKRNLPNIRWFECHACGYRLRMGRRRCPACLTPTRIHNRYGFWALALMGVALMLMASGFILNG